MKTLIILPNPFLIATITVLVFSPAVVPAADPTGPKAAPASTVTIRPDKVLAKNFLGFGVQWEYEGDHRDNNVDNPVWMKHWPEMLKRIDFMRPAVFRVMHNASMYSRLENGKIIPDYNSPRMEVMYRVLDYAKTRNIPVVYGEWWLPGAYFKPLDGIECKLYGGGTANPRWSAEIIAPFLIYLREQRGYTNIVYFNLMNEPEGLKTATGVPLDFNTWKEAILNLHTALRSNGLDQQIQILGSDGPGDWKDWIKKTAADARLNKVIGAYEYHLYAHLKTDIWAPSLVEGKMEKGELRPRRQWVNTLDPNGASKPFFMGEAGIDDGNTGDNQTNRFSFAYGVWMADYAIQSIRAGQAGLIAWDMDDAMHTGGSYGELGIKGWGFWNSLAGYKNYPADDFNLRPWFYTWSLMCRLFPSGSHTLAVSDTGDSACRVAAARLPDDSGFSFAIVNESNTPRQVTLKVLTGKPTTLHEYHYFAADRPVDDHGFPLVSVVHKNVNLTAGLTVHLPAMGAVFLTTQSPATFSAQSK